MALATQLLKIFEVLVAYIFNIFFTFFFVFLVDVLLYLYHESIFQHVLALVFGLNSVFFQNFQSLLDFNLKRLT